MYTNSITNPVSVTSFMNVNGTNLKVPDVGVPVGGTGDNPVGLSSPVNAGYPQVVLVQG